MSGARKWNRAAGAIPMQCNANNAADSPTHKIYIEIRYSKYNAIIIIILIIIY